MTLKESIISAAQDAGFTVTESFVDNDPVTLSDDLLIFISSEGSELTEEWRSLEGESCLGINRRLKATAFAASPLGTEELLNAVEYMQKLFTADSALYDITFSVSAPKRNELHKRVQCDIHITAAEMISQ